MVIIKNKTVENRAFFPKNIDNGSFNHILHIHSELTQKDYEFDVVDEDVLTSYYVFDVNLSNVEDGEYVYYIDNVACGLIRVGDFKDERTEYNKDDKVMYYEG